MNTPKPGALVVGQDPLPESGAADPALIVLDCMRYTRESRQAVHGAPGRPAILAVSSAVAMALELVD